MRFQGKNCIITASSTGIGLAIAQRFALEGGKVVISSRKQENVDEAVLSIKQMLEKKNLPSSNVIGHACHVADPQQRQDLIQKCVQNFGNIDVLVSNAAISTYTGKTISTPEFHMKKMFEVNVFSSFLLVQESFQFMNKGSSVLLISSYAGYNPQNPIGMYGVTKTALLGLTKALASEFQAQEIRVNCICPGLIKTKFAQALWEKNSQNIPVGLPEDIAGAAAFICSADGRFMTGESIVVSGQIMGRL